MKIDESKKISYCVHLLFNAMYFFDSKNSPQTLGLEQAAPQ